MAAVARAIAGGLREVIGYRSVRAGEGLLGRRLEVVATVRGDVPAARHRELARIVRRRVARELGDEARVGVRLERADGRPR